MLKNPNMVKDTFIIEKKHKEFLRKKAYRAKTNKSKVLRSLLNEKIQAEKGGEK